MVEARRVVITGLGVVSPVGLNVRTFWDSMLAGETGLKTISSFDTAGYAATVAGEIENGGLAAALKSAKIRPTDRSVDMGLLAAREALIDGRMIHEGEQPERSETATIFGCGAGPSAASVEGTRRFLELGLSGLRPSTVPTCMHNAVTAQISLRWRLGGPNYVIASACTSATAAIGTAFRQIREGHADRILAGGTEAILNPAAFGAWNNLGVMSKNPDPHAASRPFDRDRDGMVLGEGAGALLLESLESARDRDATIRGEVVGFAETSDAVHLTRPDSDGQVRAMEAALRSADASPGDVGFINAHGTGTPANDPCEARSIRRVFGPAADDIPVASNKGFFGHTLGAAGALETLTTVLGLEAGRVPGNLSLENPDPECDIRLVGREAEDVRAELAMKSSFGFGGHNAVLVLRRFG